MTSLEGSRLESERDALDTHSLPLEPKTTRQMSDNMLRFFDMLGPVSPKIVSSQPRLVVFLELRTRYGRGVMRGLSESLAAISTWERVVVETYERLPATLALPTDCLVTQYASDEVLSIVRARKIRTVITTHQGPSGLPPTAIRICLNNREVAEHAVRALAEIGLRRVAVVDHARAPHGWGRIAEYVRAAQMENFEVVLVRNPDHPQTEPWPSPQLEQLNPDGLLEFDAWAMSAPGKAWGLIGYDDYQASAIYPHLHRLGLNVPHDVAVIGTNNDTEVCEFSNPPLTSVDPSPELIGLRAGKALQNWTADGPASRRNDTVPVRGVVMRASTDALGSEDPIVLQVWAAIRATPINSIDLPAILAQVPMSRRQIERRFDQQLGMSPAALVRFYRIQRAKHLLAFSSMPIIEISLESGFTTPSRLSEAFRQSTGISPQKYRQRLR